MTGVNVSQLTPYSCFLVVDLDASVFVVYQSARCYLLLNLRKLNGKKSIFEPVDLLRTHVSILTYELQPKKIVRYWITSAGILNALLVHIICIKYRSIVFDTFTLQYRLKLVFMPPQRKDCESVILYQSSFMLVNPGQSPH